MRWAELFITGVVIGFVGHYQSAEPNLVREVYYDISPNSWDTLTEALLENGPVDRRGVRRFALTTWKMRWNWKHDSDGSPLYSTAIVTPEITIVLPRWNSIEQQPQESQERWSQTLSTMRAHELTHARTALEGASSLEKNLRLARTTSDVEEMIQEMKSRVERADIAFDQKTDHDREALNALIAAKR